MSDTQKFVKANWLAKTRTMKKLIILSCVMIFFCVESKSQQIDNVMKTVLQSLCHDFVCQNMSYAENTHGIANRTMITADGSQCVNEYKTNHNGHSLILTYWFWNDKQKSNYHEARKVQVTYKTTLDQYSYSLERYDDNGQSRCK